MLDKTFIFLEKYRSEISSVIYCKSNDIQTKIVNNQMNNEVSFEIIVVDDGSKDNTIGVVKSYASSVSYNNKKDVLRVIKLNKNNGKGAAVRAGMLESNSNYCLMVDADGATEISDLLKLLVKMQEILPKGRPSSPALVLGSRKHLEDVSSIERSRIRTLLMHIFHFFVRTLCSSRILDTQCGFKLFTRSAAITLFSQLHLSRWAFDIEILTMAERLSFPMAEVGVNWTEVDGSKLDESKLGLALNSVGMLRDMICVSLCYKFGIWNLERY